MRRLYFILFNLMLIVPAANGQQPVRLSLQDCLEYAVKHNYSIKNAKIDVLIQESQNRQTLSASYPHINGKAEFDDFIKPQASFLNAKAFGGPDAIVPIAFAVPYAASVGLTASQLVFDGSVLVALKARNTVMDLVRQSGQVTEVNMRYNVIKAYNSLVIAYRQYDILKSSLAYARSLEHDVIVTKENGFAEKIDVDRTAVQVNNLVADSMRVGNMLNLTEQVLKYQMGMDINTPVILTDTNLEQRSQEAARLLTEQGNYELIPEYKLLNTQLRLNEYNLKRYQLAAWPSFNVFGAVGNNYGSDKFGDLFKFRKYESNAMFGLQLNLPILNGMLRVNQVAEAKLNIEKSHNSIENMKLTLDFMSAQARTSLRNSILQVQSQSRNLTLSADVLDLARKKFKAGVGSNLEVTQAQTDQLRAQTNYFSALLDMINAEVDLKKAMGQIR
jgi:outer membrane protein